MSVLPPIRVLVVEDHRDWRKLIRLLLQLRPEWEIICEVSDGSEAVQKAEEMKPGLILLDIRLPKLDGIEAARKIKRLTPDCKIIFLTMDDSPDVLQAALSTGAQGYVYKSRAQSDLLPAIETVLRGEQFVSAEIEGAKPADAAEQRAPHRHEALFYRDDAVFLDRCTRFNAAALEVGDVVAVVATESHQESLFQRLRAEGLDVDAAIKHGQYLSLDVAKTLSLFMENDMPDPKRFFDVVGGFVSGAARAGKRKNSRVAICGECGPTLWAEGKLDAAIQLEQLLNQLAPIYEFDILCAYALSNFHGEEDEHVFQSLCAEHSAVFRT
jgi:DNA-binding NarL/FixJ family response regulator